MLTLKATNRKLLQPSTTTVVTSAPRVLRLKNNKKKNRPARPSAHPVLASYANTLNDPFEHSGIALGYNTFLPTTQLTGYTRSSLTVNADGSFSIALFPSAGQFIAPDNAGQNTNRTASFAACSNFSAISSNVGEARVISAGLRVFCLFPQTSASGVLFSGSAPDFAANSFNANSAQTLSALPGSKLGIGSSGASITLRPYDNDSFNFYLANTSGFGATAVPFNTSGYICGIGFPAGTTVWYEAVINLEGIAKTNSTSSANPADFEAPPTASSIFSTPTQLWSAVQSLLTAPNLMDAALVGSSFALRGRSKGMMALSSSLARRFGSGSSYQRAIELNGRRSTFMIEEMKEEAGDFVAVKKHSASAAARY